MKTNLSSEQASFVVRLAWEDRTSFEEKALNRLHTFRPAKAS